MDTNGIVVVDKPQGMTSHDVVNRIRRLFRTTKVGHLGTLDPMATGVLPVCIGKATRLGQFVQGTPKEYRATIRFGFATETYDREGAPTGPETAVAISEEAIRTAMREFTGEIEQTPPPYSAKKIGGVPAYKLARRGKDVHLNAVKVTVEVFELIEFRPPFADVRVVCSPGTYIRSLAQDLGALLECGAHLSALRRTRSGDFRIEQATPLEGISAATVIPLEGLLTALPRLDVSESDELKVARGVQLATAVPGPMARIFNKQGEFIAVAAIENGWAHPRVVLTSIASD